jgi:TPP-dependent pyruvate/acetoin dehydrogenase alpha subunit
VAVRDPIERLKQHLIGCGEWSAEQHSAQEKEVVEEVTAAREAESYGRSVAAYPQRQHHVPGYQSRLNSNEQRQAQV